MWPIKLYHFILFQGNKHKYSDVNNNMCLRPAAPHSLEVTKCVFVLASNGTPSHSNAADDQLLWKTNTSTPKVHPLSYFLYLVCRLCNTSHPLTQWHTQKAKNHTVFHELFEEDETTHTFIQISFSSNAEVVMTHWTPTQSCHKPARGPYQRKLRSAEWLHHQSQRSQYSHCSQKHQVPQYSVLWLSL